jgi:hypothetical protein
MSVLIRKTCPANYSTCRGSSSHHTSALSRTTPGSVPPGQLLYCRVLTGRSLPAPGAIRQGRARLGVAEREQEEADPNRHSQPVVLQAYNFWSGCLTSSPDLPTSNYLKIASSLHHCGVATPPPLPSKSTTLDIHMGHADVGSLLCGVERWDAGAALRVCMRDGHCTEAL